MKSIKRFTEEEGEFAKGDEETRTGRKEEREEGEATIKTGNGTPRIIKKETLFQRRIARVGETKERRNREKGERLKLK